MFQIITRRHPLSWREIMSGGDADQVEADKLISADADKLVQKIF